MKFKDLDEAQAAYDSLETKYNNSQNARKIAEQGQKDAEEIANDAMAKVGKYEKLLPKKITAKVGKQEVEILFGLDGLSKEDLTKPEHSKKVAELLKNGSSAVKLVEE